MAFRFNWLAMDDSVAEMVRLLVNDKLEEVLRERWQANPVVTQNAPPEPSRATPLFATSTGATGLDWHSTAVGGGGGGASGSYRTGANDESVSTLFPFSQAMGPNVAGPGMSGASGGATMTTSGANTGNGAASTFNAALPPFMSSTTGPAIAPTAASTSGSTAAGAAPGIGSSPSGGVPESGAGGSRPRLPPIRELYVDAIEWGVAAPFVECVAFEDALQFDDEEIETRTGGGGGFPSGAPQQPSSYRQPSRSSARQGSSVTATTADFEESSTTGGGGFIGAVPSRTSSRLAASPEGLYTLHTAMLQGAASVSREETGSENLTPHAAAAGAMAPSSSSRPPRAPTSQPSSNVMRDAGACEDTRATAEAERGPADSIARILGPNGLFVRLHVTYGGAMSFSVKTVVQHELTAGPISFPVCMPLEIRAGDVDLDCFVCVNIRQSECRVWLEPGKLSPSPLNRLNLIVVFGTQRCQATRAPWSPRHRGGGGGGAGDGVNDSLDDDNSFLSDPYGDSYNDYESSSPEEGDDEAVYVDESAISQFVLRELKAILQEKLVAPHYVRIPIV